MKRRNIAKLLVCLTGKPSSKFHITFHDSADFSLLEQYEKINIPKPSNINEIELRAVIDLISVLHLYHNQKTFTALLEKYPRYLSLISSLEEARLFLIALRAMSGMRRNIEYYINNMSLENDISNQLFVLLVRREQDDYMSEYKIARNIIKRFDSIITRLSAHLYKEKKYYEIIEEVISNLNKLDVAKERNTQKETKNSTGENKKYDNKLVPNNNSIKEEIETAIDNLRVKSSTQDNDISHTNNTPKIKHYKKLKIHPSNQEVQKYSIFTNRFDEVTTPHKIMSSRDKKLLWNKLKPNIDKNIRNRSLSKLAVKLQTTQLVNNTPFQESGKLSLKMLPHIISNPNLRNCYQRDDISLQYNHHITFLLDNSGSMQGEPIMNTIIATYNLCKLLEKFHISTEILGYTTKSWRGGESYKLWVKNSKPKNPGRVNDLRHIVYKSATDGIIQVKKSLSLMLKDGFLKENIDGEALLWARNRLRYNKAKKKNIVVISDGTPIDEVTLELNKKDILSNHLKSIIATLETNKDINLIGCGINYDVSKLYRTFINLVDHKKLNDRFVDQFCKLCI